MKPPLWSMWPVFLHGKKCTDNLMPSAGFLSPKSEGEICFLQLSKNGDDAKAHDNIMESSLSPQCHLEIALSLGGENASESTSEFSFFFALKTWVTPTTVTSHQAQFFLFSHCNFTDYLNLTDQMESVIHYRCNNKQRDDYDFLPPSRLALWRGSWMVPRRASHLL